MTVNFYRDDENNNKINENNMTKIVLKEEDLMALVNESVKRVINEAVQNGELDENAIDWLKGKGKQIKTGFNTLTQKGDMSVGQRLKKGYQNYKTQGELNDLVSLRDMLKQGVVGIVDLIATPSLINLDFADVNTVMRNQGLAHMGIGRAKGENRIIEAVRQAVSSPLLETTIEGAKSVILNITGGKDIMLSEINEASLLVQGIIDDSANIIFGATIDETMNDEVKITIIATGFSANNVDVEQDIAIKPAMSFASVNRVEKEVPPLLRDFEEPKQEEVKVEQEVVEPEQMTIVETIEEQEKPVEVKKERELPAFMRKLFKK
jgi:cell division protein FtsZ